MTELKIEHYIIPASELRPENPLPVFRGTDPDIHPFLDDSIPEDDRKYLGWRTSHRVLPYKMQDNYGRKMSPRSFTSVVLENEYLRVTVLPELGGRVASLYHKPSNTELVDPVKHVQFANFALRNAWFTCGIEWNTPHLGHHCLSCSPMYAARVKGSQGEPALRLYAWERMKSFPYQIDLHLPPESEFLFARVRLVNIHDYEIPMYWWTNIGVPETTDRRVLVPAESAIHNIWHENSWGFSLTKLPKCEDYDFTYSTNAPEAKEFFFRIRNRRPWIAQVDAEGCGVIHTSTERLRGRKMFVFGMNQGGRHWQDYLLGQDRAYLEIQAGLATTQMESVPMPANAEWTWTEAFGRLEADSAETHSENWDRAWRHVDSILDKRLPQAQLDKLDKDLAEITIRPPEEILYNGDGWGALERRWYDLRGDNGRIPLEFVFPDSVLNSEQEPWLKLLESGMMPEKDVMQEPASYVTNERWQPLLEEAVCNKSRNNWYAWLQLGVMRQEAGDTAGAKEAWFRSIEIQPNAWALRNLAVIAVREQKYQEAADLLKQAWDLGPHIAPLALEYTEMLLQLEEHDTLRQFVNELPEEIKQHERMLIVSAKLALHTGDLTGVESIFEHEFATIREGEPTLTDLWFAWQAERMSKNAGVPIDDELRKHVKRECPPPWTIDFRMTVEG